MQTIRSKAQYLPTAILIVVGVLVWAFMASDVIAYYEATYAESAHGHSTKGVNRSGAGHDIGDCANCHDTFDSNFCGNDPNGLMLFAPRNPTSQTANFCFQCHCDPVSSAQFEMVDNYDYGARFGGGDPANSTNIQDAFNFGRGHPDWTTGSSHNLQLVRNWTRTKPPGDWISNDTNACLVCHDPHLSQKNNNDPYPTPPTYKTAIRRPHAPSSGTNRPGNLWGDESGASPPELTAEDPGAYQAPYYGSGPWDEDGPFEPAGDGTSDGSNLPNFVRFCAYESCHSLPIPNAATDADPSTVMERSLFAIDWTSSGNAHGARADGPNYSGVESCWYGSLKPPYDDPDENYVLACTDCHEPHGSESVFLLRRVVNGKEVPPIEQWIGTMESGGMLQFCTACHNLNMPCGPHACRDELECSEWGCGYCHSHWQPTAF